MFLCTHISPQLRALSVAVHTYIAIVTCAQCVAVHTYIATVSCAQCCYAHIYHIDFLKVPFIKDVIQEKSINYHGKLGNNSNPILQPLLEQQQRRR
jgi:hypothetical protein